MAAKRFYSNHGSPYRVTYSSKVCSDGHIEVVESGKENVHEYIQSFKEETSLPVLINRFRNGDVSALNARTNPMYGDFTKLPTSYSEVLQRVIDAERFFDTLSADVRSKFDNDFHKFFSSIGDDDFLERIELVKKSGISIDDPVKSEIAKEAVAN